jgi:hypothetical protein
LVRAREVPFRLVVICVALVIIVSLCCWSGSCRSQAALQLAHMLLELRTRSTCVRLPDLVCRLHRS